MKTRLLRLAVLALLVSCRVFAHDAPNDVTVRAFLKPEGQRLRLLVRVPTAAMQDVVFREREKGFLDFDYAGVLLPGAAKVWLSDAIDVYEEGAVLPKPEIVRTRLTLESDKSFVTYEQALDRKSTRLNSSHIQKSRMPSSA